MGPTNVLFCVSKKNNQFETFSNCNILHPQRRLLNFNTNSKAFLRLAIDIKISGLYYSSLKLDWQGILLSKCDAKIGIRSKALHDRPTLLSIESHGYKELNLRVKLGAI